MSWESDTRGWLIEVKGDLRQEVETIVEFGVGFAQTVSPVDSGAYRANINHSEGSPDYSFSKSKTSGKTVVRVTDPFKTQYISQGAPYGEAIENGHSKEKAPAGVFGITAKAMKSRFNL